MPAHATPRRCTPGRRTPALRRILLGLAASLVAATAVPAAAQQPTLRSIRVDGSFADWRAVLLSPSQVTLDGDGSKIPCNLSPDRDCPIIASRDMRIFAWTYDATYFYIYTTRNDNATGSGSFSVFVYFDVGDDGLMNTGDYVLRVRWSPSNGTTDNDLFRYQPALASGDPLVDADGFADGYTLPGVGIGSPVWSETAPHGGGSNALRMEERVPWSALGVAPGSPLGFHVSSSNNANPQQLPFQTDDNLGGPGGGAGSTGFDAVSIEPDNRSVVPSGDSASYQHLVTNLGNRAGTFELWAESSLGLAVSFWTDPDGDGVPNALMGRDANGDGDFSDASDVLSPDFDRTGDGRPDTGLLAPGARFPIVVTIRTRGQASVEDVTTVTAALSTRPTEVFDTATDRTAIGDITLTTTDPSNVASTGGESAFDARACNAGSPDTIELTATSSRGWPTSLWSDPDCDGQRNERLARDLDGDGTWDEVSGGDSNGDGNPDTGLLASGECACFVLVVSVPCCPPDGTLDTTALEGRGSASGSLARVLLTTRLAPRVEFFPDYLAADGEALRSGPDKSAFFAHVLRNNWGSPDAFDLTAMNDRGWTVRFWSDPNADGNPADGEIITRSPLLDANGDEASIIVEVVVPPDAAFDDVSRTIATARSFLDGSVSDDVTDDLIVSRVASFRDPLFTLAATHFGPCSSLYIEASGLSPGLAPGEDPYDLVYRDATGAVVRFVDDFAPDISGRAQDAFSPDGSETPGTWTVELLEDGLLLDAIPVEVEAQGSIDSLASDEPTYPLTGADLTVATSIASRNAVAGLQGTRIDTVIISPDESLYLRSGPPSSYEPWSGSEVTDTVAVPPLAPDETFGDTFTVVDVTHPVQGVYTVRSTWVASCGIVIDERETTFIVGGGETDCSNGLDDDGDGLTDCDDPECAADPACVETDCGNGLDDDGDGPVDCEDSDCAGAPECTPESDCDNGIDDDLDGLVDCNDPDCVGDLACPETDCSNGADDDLDGLIDCDDPDCTLDPGCREIDCGDGIDDDGDELIDCNDPDCSGDPLCEPEIDCSNGLDDDGDGAIDCDDPDCDEAPECLPESPCDDGVDNDGDGLVDCDDPDCLGQPACPEMDCGNAVDDDGDGLIDCADPDCLGRAPCSETDCMNGVDDDGDGAVDCDDVDCFTSPDCIPEDCANGVDDDGDGLVDCNDPQCFFDPACREIACTNGVDDDGDGLTDCDDPDCAADPACAETDCTNGLDDDGDGAIDCDDTDCVGTPSCVESDCTNGIDDDGDGLVDCDDSDCVGTPECGEADCTNMIDDDGDGAIDCTDSDCFDAPECTETDCANMVDDDGDGLVDCADPDCVATEACVEDCENGIDDDGDGAIDCEDFDCRDTPPCVEVECTNGLDDDGDGLVDCADPDCGADPACGEIDCTNGADDDFDGLVDCADPDCADDPACFEIDCTNGIDDDGDGATDCADTDCADDPACVEIDCTNGIDDDGDGTVDCADTDCADDPACVEIDCTNGIDDDGDGATDCADTDCADDPGCVEIDCTNGIDDDGDGATDCADTDCADDPACIEMDCTDGLDDDGDGLVDCADPDCTGNMACVEEDCVDGVDDDGDGLVDCADPDCLLDPACDCDPTDPGVFAAPPEVPLLLVDAPQDTVARLQWTDLVPLAGADTVHDVATGLISELWKDMNFSRASCLSDDQTSSTFIDPRLTGRDGDGYYYLVRGQNSCGTGSWGQNSFGEERVIDACP